MILHAMLRKHRKHFKMLPPLTLAFAGLGPSEWGLCVPGPRYFIFISLQAPESEWEAILLHELCHAEVMLQDEHYEHGEPWLKAIARVAKATGVNVT